MKIAFLGLGNMGEPMALNLIRAGHEVTVFNRTAAKAAALAEAGARVAKSPADAVREAEAAISILANDQALRETILSDGAAIETLPRGAVHMCCATISVTLSKELAREHAKRGQGYVAAPVLGRPEAAAAKNLWIVAAGPPDQVERCRPLMEAMGRGISVMGEHPWQANVTKIAANFMIASALETMGEAFALIRKSGMDPRGFLEVMNPFFNSPIYTNYSRIIAGRQFDPAGFRLKLGLKDVGLALEAAQDLAVPMPLASLIRDHYLDAIAHGREDSDWSAVAEVAARNAGLEGE
ncbi:MAG TPA: NAD(P)-dependent oxidoreductase [Patescibacteria group bacterium]|nr:NAD(P)-dependent oxidoreductase [Patescibacteria group bacterium]